jgi:hypothetical protein
MTAKLPKQDIFVPPKRAGSHISRKEVIVPQIIIRDSIRIKQKKLGRNSWE